MAFAGLKKQINKANQYVTEKMGGAEGTKLDLDFMEMERKTDVTVELVEELQAKTKEYLQPNPTARAKMIAVKGISKLSGQAKSNTYPQAEGVLADCMLIYGKRLGEDTSLFAQALVEFGDSLKQMADVKYSLDDNVKQNFLEPLHQLQMKDLKEVMVEGWTLIANDDVKQEASVQNLSSVIHYMFKEILFPCKPNDEIKGAEEKFAESLSLAQLGMFHLLENDVEQISQMAYFAEALLDYHQQCTEILKGLVETMQEKREEAAQRPKSEFIPKTLADLAVECEGDGFSGTPGTPVKPNHLEIMGNGSSARSTNASPLPSPMRSPAVPPQPQQQQPCCIALYDFDPENPGELGFKENDIIQLLQRVDDNWYEGKVNGKQGYFPQSYVEIKVPLP